MASFPPRRRRRVVRHRRDDTTVGRATLAVEEPLEIRVDTEVLAVTMRTPGHDFELAVGLAITDGGLRPDAVASARYCADQAGPYTGDFNVVTVGTREGRGPLVHRHRHGVMSSSCGICGADVVADLRERAGSVSTDAVRLDGDVVAAIPRTARAHQTGFEATGAMHAAALFDDAGRLLVLREDVGRHNAVDKVVGWAASADALPLAGRVLFTTGRIAFEIVAKAAVAGIPAIVAVSAPTSLAVDLAEEVGMTLVGFARGEDFTVYTRAERVTSADDGHATAGTSATDLRGH